MAASHAKESPRRSDSQLSDACEAQTALETSQKDGMEQSSSFEDSRSSRDEEEESMEGSFQAVPESDRDALLLSTIAESMSDREDGEDTTNETRGEGDDGMEGDRSKSFDFEFLQLEEGSQGLSGLALASTSAAAAAVASSTMRETGRDHTAEDEDGSETEQEEAKQGHDANAKPEMDEDDQREDENASYRSRNYSVSSEDSTEEHRLACIFGLSGPSESKPAASAETLALLGPETASCKAIDEADEDEETNLDALSAEHSGIQRVGSEKAGERVGIQTKAVSAENEG
eukprot:802842-Rhodomonas_salina.1